MMGRLDLNDRRVDWVSVTREYLDELYDEIARLRAENDMLIRDHELHQLRAAV